MNSILHFVRFIIGLDKPGSQVTDAELAMLTRYAGGRTTAVELGCYEGKTMVAIAKVIVGTAYSIDPFFKGRLRISYGKLIARIYARRNQIHNFRLIEKLSWEAAPDFRIPIDFLFIDADHSYEAVRRDWLDWSPKITTGGIIALHDSKLAVNSSAKVGSMEFYERDIPTFKEFVEVDTVDSLVVLQKHY